MLSPEACQVLLREFKRLHHPQALMYDRTIDAPRSWNISTYCYTVEGSFTHTTLSSKCGQPFDQRMYDFVM